MSLLTAKVHRRTELHKWEKKRNAERKKNIHTRLSTSNTGDYLFTEELVNNTVVSNVFPMHAMKACGEVEI